MTHWYIKANELRKAKGLRMRELAELIDVSEGAVSHYMRGRRTPDLARIKRIAAVLDTTISWLMEDDPYFIQSDDERRIIDLFRDIPEDQRYLAEKLLNSLKPSR